MKLISLSALEPGKLLGRPIFNEKGTLLLGSGVAVTSRYLRRLKEMGYTAVYIEEKGYEDIEVKDVVSDKTRIEAVSTISETFEAVRDTANSKKTGLDARRVSGIADKIVDDLVGSDNQIMDLIDLKSFDNYTFLHSVNVSVLAVLVAANYGSFTTMDLRDIAMGALLHDIGMAHIPKEIVQKQGRLSGDEFRHMKNHCTIGYEIIQHKASMKPLIASVPLQHQEYYNGTGYPNGLEKSNIHIYSRLCGIADVFDALTSDRCFKRRLPPSVGLEYLQLGNGTHFDPELLELFGRHVARYPIGGTVVLNTGETAVVLSNNKDQMDRPVVRVLTTPDGKDLDKFHEIDLSSQTEYEIESVKV
ncbi:MAG: HD-GYP domain-containing protein [Gemmatimonadota bacterium]|nr:HD-GYP domain-containing protein [Gemmatimonadota bacterium]